MGWSKKQKAGITPRLPKDPGYKTCIACNGSGVYDNNGSPPCGACGGTGKVKDK